MNLLIKLYLKDLNPYDILQILGALNSAIEDKETTKIQLVTNDSTFDFEGYDYLYTTETNTPKSINLKLSETDWDIILPIFRPSIAVHNFDSVIKKIYQESFSNLDGVLWFTDNLQKELATFAVIGREYYNNFGYIYNPIYTNYKFEDEFTEVLKINNKYKYQECVLFKMIPILSDDEKIFEFRKKLNFTVK
jgi:hypothetical protein